MLQHVEHTQPWHPGITGQHVRAAALRLRQSLGAFRRPLYLVSLFFKKMLEHFANRGFVRVPERHVMQIQLYPEVPAEREVTFLLTEERLWVR